MGPSHSGVHAPGSLQRGTRAQTRAPPPGQRAHECAPAQPRRAAAEEEEEEDRQAMPIWMDRTTARRTRTRAEEAVDTTAMDAKAAAAKDTTAAGEVAADTKERWPRRRPRRRRRPHRTHSLRRKAQAMVMRELRGPWEPRKPRELFERCGWLERAR